MWCACKAPSRVQWYSKLHTLVFNVCFCRVTCVYGPLTCSVVPKNYTLSCSVRFFPAGRTHEARVSEKKKSGLTSFARLLRYTPPLNKIGLAQRPHSYNLLSRTSRCRKYAAYNYSPTKMAQTEKNHLWGHIEHLRSARQDKV